MIISGLSDQSLNNTQSMPSGHDTAKLSSYER